jgi:hypothetical protein
MIENLRGRTRIIEAANYTPAVGLLETPRQAEFAPLQPVGDTPGWRFRKERLVNPGNEERVAKPRVQHRRAGKEVVRVALVEDEKADLITHPFAAPDS